MHPMIWEESISWTEKLVMEKHLISKQKWGCVKTDVMEEPSSLPLLPHPRPSDIHYRHHHLSCISITISPVVAHPVLQQPRLTYCSYHRTSTCNHQKRLTAQSMKTERKNLQFAWRKNSSTSNNSQRLRFSFQSFVFMGLAFVLLSNPLISSPKITRWWKIASIASKSKDCNLLFEGSDSKILALAVLSPSISFLILLLCSFRKPFRPIRFEPLSGSPSLPHPFAMCFGGAIFSSEHVDDEIDLRWADSSRALGGERMPSSGTEHVVDDIDLRWGDSTRFFGGERGGEVLTERTRGGVGGIACGWAAAGSFWKRDRRLWLDWRSGKSWGG